MRIVQAQLPCSSKLFCVGYIRVSRICKVRESIKDFTETFITIAPFKIMFEGKPR